ncbi:MAG: hypothetical protein M3Q03_04730 [Chloroflexota bacterium]|nr:hypothetical protein [Chloroflexota bacterium]
MALLDFTDLERQKNVTLTIPNGQELANKIAKGIVSWAERRSGYSFAAGPRTDYFDQGGSVFQLKTPVNVSGVSVALYNSLSGAYDAYPYGVRASVTGEVRLDSPVSAGFQAVRISYTAGWTDLQFRDTALHGALSELLAQKFDATQSGSQTLKSVSVGSYREEYALQSQEIPADVMEVVDSYRRVVVF